MKSVVVLSIFPLKLLTNRWHLLIMRVQILETEENSMKKALSLALSLLFILTLVAGCGSKTNNVTAENVKDLFLPTLKCYAYYDGSGLYTVEKNTDGTLKQYGEDEAGNPFFKVVGFDSYEKLVAEYEKYVSKDLKNINAPIEKSFKKTDDGLLVARYDGGAVGYNPDSIKLEKEENGKYYISTDKYGISNDGNDNYVGTEVFTATYQDGILCIESSETLTDDAKTGTTVPSSDLMYTYAVMPY